MKTLIADDNADDRRMLRCLLEHHDCQVIEAVDGQHALELTALHMPTLIISDALMPRMDGFQFLRAVKTDKALQAIPFVFYSATYTGAEEAELAISLGAEAFIIKPKDPVEFWEELSDIIDGCNLKDPERLSAEPIKEDHDYLLKYSNIVANKLEEKVKELEHALALRRQAEEEILRAKNEWVETFDTINEAISIHDRDFNIIRANRAAEELLGIPNQDIIGKKCYESFHCSGCPAEGCPAVQCLQTGMPVVKEHYEPHLGKYLEIRAIPRFDSDKQVIGLVHIVRDITDRKKAEEEQRSLQDQLRHSQKLEAVGTLAGGIAHDFNNILSVIVGYCNLMEMKMPEGDPLGPYLKEILAAAERATHLSKGLLIFSRKQAAELKAFDINELIRGMQKMVLRIIGADIETDIALADGRLAVKGDYGQLEQVMMNFATNARDAMPDGGLLTIRTELFEIDNEFAHAHGFGKPGRYALISISDTGKGMDQETREKIFEPFFTTKEVGKGTGLGLSIVYGIVKQHNGYINCYSEPDQGTTFRVYLPLVHDEAADAIEAEAASPPHGTETILLVDDDPNVRKLTKDMLEQFGYTVLEALDGAEAVRQFMDNRDRIDLLLFDVIMPKKSGKDALDEIRLIQPGMKVLFVSGYPDDIIRRKGIAEEPYLHFMQKPVKILSLLTKIREILDSKE